MPSKKVVSIVLASVFVVCALSFIAVGIYIFHVSQDTSGFLLTLSGLLLNSIVFDLILISSLLCLAAAAALLVSAGRRTNPVAISLWSAGALFVAVPNIPIFFSAVLQSGSEEDGFIFIVLLIAASAVALITGIASCIFASKLQRQLLSCDSDCDCGCGCQETPVEAPAEAPAAQEETKAEEQK